MSNRRYIEIYSARRNRHRFPKVSQFEIPLEDHGMNNSAASALDPVVLAFPSYIFKLNTAASTPPTSGVLPFIGLGAKKFSGGSRSSPQIDTAPAALGINFGQFTNDFYAGYRIIDTTINEARTIISYNYINQSLTLEEPFSTRWNSDDCYIIVDPSVPFDTSITGLPGSVQGTAANPVLDFNGAIQLPALPFNFPTNGYPAGYFSGFNLQIIDALNPLEVLEERKILDIVQISPGSNLYQIQLDNNFTINWINGATWFFNIFLVPNFFTFPFIHLQPTDVFNIGNPAGSTNQYFTNSIVFNECTNEGRKIVGYNGPLKLAALEDGFTPSTFINPLNATNPSGTTGTLCPTGPVGVTGSYTIGSNPYGTTGPIYSDCIFSIRKELPCYVGSFTGTYPVGSNFVCFDPNNQLLGQLPVDNGEWGTTKRSPDCCTPYAWCNKYLYIRPTSYSFLNTPSSKNIYMITEYYGASGGTGPNGQVIPPYCALLNRPLEIPATAGKIFEILPFSYDNASPFCYLGSTVSQQEQVCYEVRLISIVLPNTVLITGSRVSFYPFVYVQFGTAQGSSMNHSNCIIYSNNPPANRALFIAPTNDIANPNSSQFIKLDGNGAVQTIKFKPNENLVFSVFLPNGELFEPFFPDTSSPLPANPLYQIEAIFEIKRL